MDRWLRQGLSARKVTDGGPHPAGNPHPPLPHLEPTRVAGSGHGQPSLHPWVLPPGLRPAAGGLRRRAAPLDGAGVRPCRTTRRCWRGPRWWTGTAACSWRPARAWCWRWMPGAASAGAPLAQGGARPAPGPGRRRPGPPGPPDPFRRRGPVPGHRPRESLIAGARPPRGNPALGGSPPARPKPGRRISRPDIFLDELKISTHIWIQEIQTFEIVTEFFENVLFWFPGDPGRSAGEAAVDFFSMPVRTFSGNSSSMHEGFL